MDSFGLLFFGFPSGDRSNRCPDAAGSPLLSTTWHLNMVSLGSGRLQRSGIDDRRHHQWTGTIEFRCDDPTYYPAVDAAIQATRKQGIFVLGYTYTEYGTRDPNLVHQAISSVYQNYGVDGIFFDQAPVNCNNANTYAGTQFTYYAQLANYLRQNMAGARITVLNPGTTPANDCWMSISNILATFENSGGLSAYQTSYTSYPWIQKYPPDRFWHIVLGVTQAQLPTALSLAQARNAGWVYISDSADNAYNQVPVYWRPRLLLSPAKESRRRLPLPGRVLRLVPAAP
jgi:Spherulation-specific family 4